MSALPLPSLTSTECIAVLGRFGYRPGTRSGGLVSLHREANVVIVPDPSTLSPALLKAILRTADVDPADFVRELANPSMKHVA